MTSAITSTTALEHANCSSNGYLLSGNNTLSSIDLSTGRTKFISTLDGASSVRSLGYNILDDYLYGVGTNGTAGTLIQIGGDGASIPIAELPAPSIETGYTLGDVDEKGQGWFASSTAWGQTIYVQIDLVPFSPTRGSIVNEGVADPAVHIPHDWAYVPGAGDNLWSLGSNRDYDQMTQLLRFSREFGVWHLETAFWNIAGANTWPTVYAGANQTIIAQEAYSGEIWEFQLPIVGVGAKKLAVGDRIGDGDGTRCIDAL
ncbi:hypothetical protein F5Y18DRAFT_438888 [Xylariaceae sp. FL1019]|nr:hypothetical protein F5Y18DRAFT_438888 [Xylariaceae sp. FL1019]